MSALLLRLFCFLFFIVPTQAQILVDRDFSSENADSSDIIGKKTVITKGLGIDPSGGWTNEPKWATFPQKVAMKDGEIAVHFPVSGQGNPNSYGQVTFRATDLTSGVGVRLHGGQDAAEVAIVEMGKVIETRKIAGLSPRFAPVDLTIRLKGTSIEVDVLQEKGERWPRVEKMVSAELSDGSDHPGFFIYHAVPANLAISLAKLKITKTDSVPAPAGLNWPPQAEAVAVTKALSKTSALVPGKVEPIFPHDLPVSNRLVKDIRILSPEWVCLVMDSTGPVHEIMKENASVQEVLDRAKQELDAGTNTWYYPIVKGALIEQSQTRARLSLLPKYEDASQWSVNGAAPALVSYYPYSVGNVPTEGDSFSPHHDGNTPRIADYVYLKLSSAIKVDSTVSITHRDGLNQTCLFDTKSSPCWSIKVNQVGYLTDAKKTAYLGMWAGFEGAVDFASFDGQSFEIYTYEPGKDRWQDGRAVGAPLFTGKIKLRAKSGDQFSPVVKNLITGEDVFDMDFSDLNTSGKYCVHIPGLGRSWPFQIGDDVYGEAFFETARGLFHQRGSIALQPPYTNWVRGETRQPIYQAGFLPETDKWYDRRLTYSKRGEKAGFRTADGKPAVISAFTMIHSTATTELFPGMEKGGGWHDAADYDRRIHHYKCVWDLCGVYEMYPRKFTDGQLNLPESGNGIPDILDEAAIQVDFFLKTQRPDGGVSSWVEQTSHPGHGRPEDDTQPFYVSLPDRLGSFEFAACATYLGRLIEPFDSARAKRYFDAAKRAYAFGADSGNQITDLSFTVAEGSQYDASMIGQTLTFHEAKDLPTRGSSLINYRKFNALIQLAAAGSQAHLAELKQVDISDVFTTCYPEIHPFSCVTPLMHPEIFQTGEGFLEKLTRLSERWHHGGQEEMAYRQLWRKKDDGYFGAMAWGNSHGPVNARLPLVLYRFTGDEIWKQMVLFGMDWQFGCNAAGISHTTGVGSVYPVVFQHIHSATDAFLEPVPGFSPFQPTGNFPMFVFQKQFAAIEVPHASVSKYFPNVFQSFVPSGGDGRGLQAKLDEIISRNDPAKAATEAYQVVRDHVGSRVPMMRRYVIHTSFAPGHNEFTVNESISPHAAVLGALLPDGWMPSAEMKNRQPKMKEDELPFYPQP